MAGLSQAQNVVLFNETVGRAPLGATATATIVDYNTAKLFDHNVNNPLLTYSGSGTVSATTPSGTTGYNNILLNKTQTFIISDINTLAYSKLALSFNAFKGVNQVALRVEYNAGDGWVRLSTGALPTSNTWGEMTVTEDLNQGAMPSVENLQLRFTHSGTVGQLRIDDIKLVGVESSSNPSITSFSPEIGGEGTIVTLYGKNLGNTDFVIFEENEASVEVLSFTDEEVVVKVLDGGTTSRFMLYTANGEVATSSEIFTFVRPLITAFNPDPAYIGSTLTLTGTDLESTYSVLFEGGVTAEPISAEYDKVVVIVPEGASTGRVDVYTNMYGRGYSNEALTIYKPEITSLSKYQGRINDVVYIRGSRLNIGTYKAYFSNGVEAGIIAAAADGTELTVKVPVGAVTGPITVTTSEGTAVSETFTVLTPEIVFVNADQLTPFSTTVGTPSTAQSYMVAGNNLGGGLTIEAPSNFEISKTGASGSWVKSFFISLGQNSSIAQTPVYVRYNPSTAGSHTGDIKHSSAGVERLLTLNGTSTSAAPKPLITISKTSMSMSANVGASDMDLYQVSAQYLNAGASVVVDVTGLPGNYTISTSENGPFAKTITFTSEIVDNTLEATEVWVKFTPTATGTTNAIIAHSTEGAETKTLTVNGTALAPLPVELISFKAQKQADAVLLTWATASEKDNAYFEVEVTDNAKGEFKAVGKVNSKATNSSVKTNYQYTHAGSITGTRYYRLKQVDLDGTTSYSNVVAVEVAAMLQETVKVAPNPISPASKLLFPAAEAGKLNITIVNMSGSKVATKSADVEAGANTIELGLSEKLPAGMYILTTEFNGKTEKVKLIKQ